MKKYLGVKIVEAEPAWKGYLCAQDGCDQSEQIIVKSTYGNVNISTEWKDGYKVVYEDGYVSWSPKDVFEKAYRSIDGLTFGLAIEALKQGKKVARAGWNGKEMFLFYISENMYSQIGGWTFTNGRCDNYELCPFIAMKTADEKVVPWLASQTDVLAEDWQIVE